eukprot:gene5823-3497_t
MHENCVFRPRFPSEYYTLLPALPQGAVPLWSQGQLAQPKQTERDVHDAVTKELHDAATCCSLCDVQCTTSQQGDAYIGPTHWKR